MAVEIAAYLRSRHSYSLSPGSFGGGDPIIQWLESERSGPCELFAGGFAVPPRTAGGSRPGWSLAFQRAGRTNSYEDYFVVRFRNRAHAWCEIFDGNAWVRFDPTPGGSGSGPGPTFPDRKSAFVRETGFQA